MGQRVLVVGWDGADWEIVDDLLARGLLPNLAALLAQGGRGTLLSTIPSHSWAAWSSFLTGYQPAGHGVWDFVERDPTDPDRRVPVSSNSIRRATFLDRLSTAGLEVRAANIPVTFPAWELNGRMIGGVAIPRGAPFVTPEAWAQELERQAPFPINGMEWLRSREEPEALVREAKRIVEDRTASFEFMLEGSWDVAVCVFVAPDRLQHPFGAYLLPSHPRHAELTDTELAGELRAVYGLVDEALGRLRRAAGSDALTIVMSDHGFRQIERVLNLGRLLRAVGFSSAGSRAEMARSLRGWAPTRAIARTRLGYRLKQRVRAPSTLDWAKTIAYHAGTGGAVSINLRGREIHGVVDPADYERVRAEVVEALLSYVDPTSGQRPIRAVTRREDLPTGEHVDTAPDLMARPAAGWSFGNVGEVAVASEWPTGDHRQQGILAVSSADRRDLGAPSIVDLAPTVLASQGLAVPGIDGRVIPGVVADDVVLDEQRGVEGVFVASAAGEVSDDEQDEISQHLRDLGYIE